MKRKTSLIVNCRNLKYQNGFTLVEVLVAITVLAVGLVLVVQAMGRTQLALRMSENMANASLITEERLTALEIEARQRGQSGFGSNNGIETLPGRSYEWIAGSRPFEQPGLKPDGRLSVITAEVNWQEANALRSLKASSLILRRKAK